MAPSSPSFLSRFPFTALISLPFPRLTRNLLETNMFRLQPRNRRQHLLPQRRHTAGIVLCFIGLAMRLHTVPANSQEVRESLPTRTILVRQLTRPVDMPHRP